MVLSSYPQNSPPRLLDYLLIVGAKEKSQAEQDRCPSVILRCYPQVNHNDFELPKDVACFCQPDGCICVSGAPTGSVSTMDVTSFIFALKDKDSGSVRYGISLNFFRRVYLNSEVISANPLDVRGDAERKPASEQHTKSLVSLCLISHHPFFSKFRQCLYAFKRLLESSQRLLNRVQSNSDGLIWSLLTEPSKIISGPASLPARRIVNEIEVWIMRLLSAPSPLPGRSCVYLSILPDSIEKPLLFAFPNKNRLTLVDFPLHLPLELLGVENCLKVLTAIMLEQKVILQSRDYNSLTMCVLAFTAILYPLQYMFPVIPLLPNSLDGGENLLLSPTPYLIGIPATFLAQKRNFLIPPDVWLVDLDTNKIMGSPTIEPIPPLPLEEGRQLMEHLEKTLAGISAVPVPNTNGQIAIAPEDIDAVDVATRVAMVRFFNSANVLANLSEHTRTIRLYPQPVVAFQYFSFLRSRQSITPFIQRLAKTQAVEFLSEWSLYPENEVFQRIYAGISDPAQIGDKAKWFASSLPQINFPVWNANFYVGLTNAINNEDANPNGDVTISPELANCTELIDPSSIYCPPRTSEEQLKGAMKPRASIRRRKKLRPTDTTGSENLSTSADRDKSLSFSAAEASFDLDPSSKVSGENGSLDSSSSSDMDDNDIWDLKDINASLEQDTRAPTDLEGHEQSSHEASVGTVEAHGLQSSNAVIDQSVPANGQVIRDRTSAPTEVDNNPADEASFRDEKEQNYGGGEEENEGDDEMEETSVGKYLLTNLGDNLADAADHASSALSGLFDTQRKLVKRSGRFARKVMGELKHETPDSTNSEPVTVEDGGPDGPKSKLASSATKFVSRFNPAKKLFMFGGQDEEGRTGEGDYSQMMNTDPEQSANSQEFLRNVVLCAMKGRGLSMTAGNRLRELLCDENYRSYMISKIIMCFPREFFDPEEPVADMAIPGQAVYRVLTQLLHFMIRGLEQTCTNHGIGGLASAMTMLEICHTHFVELIPEETKASQNPKNEVDIMRSLKTGFGAKLTGQVAGLFSKANRIIQPNEPKPSDTPQSGSSLTNSTEAMNATESYDRLNATQSNHQQPVQSSGVVTASDESPSLHHSRKNSAVHEISRKTRRSNSYRFVQDHLLHIGHRNGSPNCGDQGLSVTVPDRLYLYESLTTQKDRSKVWDHMQFWEDTFFDTVAQERDILGMDQSPMEMLEKFATLSPAEKKMLQTQEDRILSTILRNLIAFMVMMKVEKRAICTRVRRIQARCRLGAYFSGALSNLLDQLEYLEGNGIDLKPTMTKFPHVQSFEVRRYSSTIEDLQMFEIYPGCILIRDCNGAVAAHWAYRDDLTDFQFQPDKNAVQLTVLTNGVPQLEVYQSDRAKHIYQALSLAWEKSKSRRPH
ncbi:unnamed protein product [Calicophoron daubneyi]|uniref:MAP kinase-activating death domain protein n=1 Tax=Calicophoron daubneyi TaxID=300641 RepID=A0AAV2U1J1_CALDB